MTIEYSRGKARPTLPRSSDLPAIDPTEIETKATLPRDEHGHFLPGTRLAIGAGLTHTIKKSLGVRNGTGEARIVTRDAKRLFSNILPTLPSDVAPVRALLAVYARHAALNAFFTAKAEQAGLDTTLGLQFLEVADRQSQRCERVLVTVHDLAKVHALKAANATFDPCPIEPPAPEKKTKPKIIEMVEEGEEREESEEQNS